jgi:hypothetical protein
MSMIYVGLLSNPHNFPQFSPRYSFSSCSKEGSSELPAKILGFGYLRGRNNRAVLAEIA